MVGSGQNGTVPFPQIGFIYDAGSYTELLPPGWENALASAINNNGEVIGCGSTDKIVNSDGSTTFINFKGYKYIAGNYTELLPPGCAEADAYGINDNGVVVGDASCGGLVKGFIATPKAPPSCVSVSRSSGMQGQTLDVTIIGSNTNFIDTGSTVNSTTVSFGCSGIRSTSPRLNSPTEVTANITIAPDAQPCTGNVTVTTGCEVVTCENAFSIVLELPHLTLTAPNGGESWNRNAKRSIRWNASGCTGTLKLTLWQNGGLIGTIADGVNPAKGSYSWTVGVYNGGIAPLGTGYTIKIEDNGSALEDLSDASFSIVKVSVKTPNGGEFWQIGSTRNITWVAKPISNNLRIVLFKNGVKVGNIVNSINPALGTYAWTAGNYEGGTATVGAGYQIQIREIGTDAGDRSDATFMLTFP